MQTRTAGKYPAFRRKYLSWRCGLFGALGLQNNRVVFRQLDYSAIRHGDGPESVGTGVICPQPPLDSQAFFHVSLKLDGKDLGNSEMPHGQTVQPIEGFNEIDTYLAAFVGTRPLDHESIG